MSVWHSYVVEVTVHERGEENEEYAGVHTYQEVKHTESQHVKREADMPVVIEEVQHLNTETAEEKWEHSNMSSNMTAQYITCKSNYTSASPYTLHLHVCHKPNYGSTVRVAVTCSDYYSIPVLGYSMLLMYMYVHMCHMCCYCIHTVLIDLCAQWCAQCLHTMCAQCPAYNVYCMCIWSCRVSEEGGNDFVGPTLTLAHLHQCP